MVRRGTTFGDDLASTSHLRCGIHDFSEFGHIQQSRATACQQYSTGIHQLHRQTVQVEVLMPSFFDFHAAADQFRWVQHYDVELLFITKHIPHISEHLGLHEIDFQLVEVRVFSSEYSGVFVQFDPGDFACLANSFRLQRKTAG